MLTVVMTMKGRKAKSAKDKAHGTKSGGNKAQASKSPLLEDPHKIHLIPPAACVKCCLPVKLIRDSVPKAFTGG